MDKFLNELTRKRFEIERELKEGEMPTATKIALSYGYTPCGVKRIDVVPYPAALFVARTVPGYDSERAKQMLSGLKSNGYEITDAALELSGKPICLTIVLGKLHKDGGGLALLDKSKTLERSPVMLAGHNNGISYAGFSLNTAPEHYGDVEKIAELFGMEAYEVTPPSAFVNAFRQYF